MWRQLHNPKPRGAHVVQPGRELQPMHIYPRSAWLYTVLTLQTVT